MDTKITAEKTYNDKNDRVADKIAQLQKRIATHNGIAKNHPKNWGYVGDLDYVEEKLDQILESFHISRKVGGG